MSNLIDTFLKPVVSSYSNRVIMADVDDLMEYPEFHSALEEKGFEILKAVDDLDARIKFELEMREQKDAILLAAQGDYEPLPDIKECVHFVKISLIDLFPELSTKVIKGLSFNALNKLCKLKLYNKLSDEKTLEFVFKNLYQLDVGILEQSDNKEFILSAIIQITIEKDEVNEPVRKYLISICSKYFAENAQEILRKDKLLKFLQKEWGNYLAGSRKIDFSHFHLQKSIISLFAMGLLYPVKVTETQITGLPKSLLLGCIFDSNEHLEDKFTELLTYLENNITEDLMNYAKWFGLIQALAKSMLISLDSANSELKSRFQNLLISVNRNFQVFIETEYDKLFSRSGIKEPVLVTKVLEYMKFNKAEKKALLVIDGMNYWQWLMIAEELLKVGIESQSKTTLAFIPSITAWSRQAIFKGGLPDLTKTNSQEEQLFKAYWKAQEFLDYQISYRKFGFGSSENLIEFSDSTRILGIVTNDLDELMHGAHLGNIQLRQNTALWLKESNFINQIKNLKEQGFKIFITTDHGSIEARGIKNLKQNDNIGSISRSKRHTHFTNGTLLNKFRENNRMLDVGIKGLSVYLKHTEAFTIENNLVVTHGGSHFWEVLVPFIEI